MLDSCQAGSEWGERAHFELPSPPIMNDCNHTADEGLDATGLVCPEPLMLVRNRVRDMRSGQILHVTATDPSTGRDFRNFCRFLGHELLEETQRGATFHYRIRKG